MERQQNSKILIAAKLRLSLRMAEKTENELRKQAQRKLLHRARPMTTAQIEQAEYDGNRLLTIETTFGERMHLSSEDRRKALGTAALLLAASGNDQLASEAIARQIDLEDQLPLSAQAALPQPQLSHNERLQALWDMLSPLRATD